MDLKESVRQWVLRELPYDPGDAALVAYLTGLDAHALLVAFYNWNSRRVSPLHRLVHKSKAFQQNPLATQRASELAQIISDIEQGQDLRKYLSRDIVRAPVRAPGSNRRDLDLMLNDWGIHHLHISSIVEADGFVKRDGPLLFVSFTPHAAYLIDIMTHRDWTRDHVLEVLAGEWPNEGVIHDMGAAPPNSITERQRANLRGNHYNSAFTYAGRAFKPAGGMMSNGTTLTAWLAARHVLGKIDIFERALANNQHRLASEFEQHGFAFPDTELEFAIREDGPGIMETKTGTWINLAVVH